MSAAPFTIEPRPGVKLKGKATREGSLWTLTLDGYPEATTTGFDLVKARRALEERMAKRMAPRA